MKKMNLKMLLHWLVSTVISFVVIYVFVLVGGWQLFESGDPILLEIAAAFAMGLVFWIMFEITRAMEEKIRELEARISALEKQN